MATSNALSTASILCSPKQVLFYTFLPYFPFFSGRKLLIFVRFFLFHLLMGSFGVTVLVGRVKEERESATQLKAEFRSINQKIRSASKCKGYCF